MAKDACAKCKAIHLGSESLMIPTEGDYPHAPDRQSNKSGMEKRIQYNTPLRESQGVDPIASKDFPSIVATSQRAILAIRWSNTGIGPKEQGKIIDCL